MLLELVFLAPMLHCILLLWKVCNIFLYFCRRDLRQLERGHVKAPVSPVLGDDSLAADGAAAGRCPASALR